MASSLLIILSVILYFSVALGSQSLELRLLTLERQFDEQQGVIAELGKRLTETENKNLILEEKLSKSEVENNELKRKISKLEKLFVDDSVTTNTNNRRRGLKHRGLSQKDDGEFLNRTAIEDKNDRVMPGDMSEVRSNSSAILKSSKSNQTPIEDRTSVPKHIIRQSRAETNGVAFHASLSTTRCFQAHEVVVFNHEEVDIGAGYNAHDGIYNIPSDGVYAFTMTVVANEGSWIRIEMLLNGVIKSTAVSVSEEDGDFHPSTAFAIVQAHSGDHVFMRMDRHSNCNVVSDREHGKSTFSK